MEYGFVMALGWLLASLGIGAGMWCGIIAGACQVL
jgi:hypothetical protein